MQLVWRGGVSSFSLFLSKMERKLIQHQVLLAFQPKTSICFISKGRVVNLKHDVVTHVSKYGNETVVYTKYNNYRTYSSLQEILNDLPVKDFFRVHRSHVVSLKYMNGIRRKRIEVGEYYLPVSKYYKMQLITGLRDVLDRAFVFYETNFENQ